MILFDFDGVLCNSWAASVKILNELAPKYRFRTIKEDEVHALSHLGSRELFKELKISNWKLPWVVKAVRKRIHSEIENLEPFEGVKEMLVELKEKNFKLGILTSNSEENVKVFLKSNDLEFFEVIYSGSSIYGKHKHLQKILETHKLSNKELVYVGDETRDIEAAQKASVAIIAVTWGFNNESVLKTLNPTELASTPSSLAAIAKNLLPHSNSLS